MFTLSILIIILIYLVNIYKIDLFACIYYLAFYNKIFNLSEQSNILIMDNHNNNEPDDDNGADSVGGSSGYETDSNRSFHEGTTHALGTADPRTLPDAVLREFIGDSADIVRHPEVVDIQDREGENNSSSRDAWVNRNTELRDELLSRIENRTTERQDSDEQLLATPLPSDDEKEKSPSQDPVPSSSLSKRKFDDDDNDNNQPDKKVFKQDSSDVHPDCEPFDFMGGDD